MFLRLVTITESRSESALDHDGHSADPSSAGGQSPLDTRRRVLRSELMSASNDPDRLEEIIDSYAGYRLLSLDHHPATRQPTVEVAHEALLREWERLRAWLEESQVDLSLHRQLGWATAEWLRAGRDDSFLLRGSRLAQFESWAEGTQLTLTEDERTYLDTSLERQAEKEAAERERQEKETRLEQRAGRRLKALVAVMVLALIVAIGLTIAAVLFARDANEQRRLALIRELASSAVANVETDPQLSLLLALEAADRTSPVDGTVLPEVEDALHPALQSHRASITYPLGGAVAYSPDGKLLAIGDEDGFLSLWDARSGDVVRELQGHLIRITDLSFSPDGRYLASSSADTLVKIWDVTTGQALANLQGHSDIIDTIAFSADGSSLASADREGLVLIWDIDEGPFASDETVQLSGPNLILQAPGAVNNVALSPDGRQLAAYMAGKSLLIWDAETKEELLEIPQVSEFAAGLAYSPGGDVLAAASPGADVSLWDPGTGEELFNLPESSPVKDLVFSQDGALLATTAEDGTSAIWDVSTGRELISLLGHPKGIGRIALSPEGGLMATSGQDSTLVWDVDPAGSRELFTVAAHEGSIHDVVYNPAGGQIATTGDDGAVKIWDSVTGTLLHSLSGQPDVINFPAYSLDGRWLASANQDGGISIWNADTGKEQLAVFDETQLLSAVSFTHDGSSLIVGGQKGAVHLFDALSGERIRTFRQEGDTVLRVNHDSKHELITAEGLEPAFNAWDNASGEHICTAVKNAIEWDTDATDDGRLIASAAFDGASPVWLPLEGEPCNVPRLFDLRGHAGGVTGVALNPEGTILASSGFDGTTRLWDMEDGGQILTLAGHEKPVNGVDISPNGRYLATAGADGMLRVYILSVDELIETARSRVSRSFTDEECERYLHLPRCLDE
jgi:WD40 repeat protein